MFGRGIFNVHNQRPPYSVCGFLVFGSAGHRSRNRRDLPLHLHIHIHIQDYLRRYTLANRLCSVTVLVAL
jgi:hypothetical protein